MKGAPKQMIDGLRASVPGGELKEKLILSASRYMKRAELLPQPNDLQRSAALLSFLADHIEEDQVYRLSIDQVVSLELHLERMP